MSAPTRRDYHRLYVLGRLMPFPLHYEEESYLSAQSKEPYRDQHLGGWTFDPRGPSGWQEWTITRWRVVLFGLPVSRWHAWPLPRSLSHPWTRKPPFPRNEAA